jgi:dipeptidase D
MMVCFSTPRPSTNYDGVVKESRNDKIREVLRTICTDKSFSYKEDSTGNILVSSAGSGKAKVCFQGHMDVVVSKNETVDHDFDTQGVDVRITTEASVKPVKGITLGADNGVAIAAGLAVMCNHPTIPMELLITKNEETDFSGAIGLDASMITADTILNLDSEVESQICAGSAGGFDQNFALTIDRELEASREACWMIKVKDMKGGHSGVDAHRERFNAILAMHRVLLETLNSGGNFKIVSVSGGTARNAIPRECSAIIQTSNEGIVALINSKFDILKAEIKIREETARIEISKIDSTGNALTMESTEKVLRFISAFPNGVMHTVPETGDIESSLNFGILTLPGDSTVLSANFFVRSTSESWLRFFAQKLTAMGKLAGAHVEEFQGFLGAWEPIYDSHIIRKLKETHPAREGIDRVKIYTIHAGLECSTLVERFQAIGRTVECASIGPQIDNAHSPDECLHIESAVHFVKWTEAVAIAL